MIKKNIFAKKLAKKFAFFAQTAVSFCKNVIITLAKIAEKLGHSIDPRF
jgi:hypothetical protein